MEENNNLNLPEDSSVEKNDKKELVITEEIEFFLMQSAKWGKFLAIVGFVACGIMALAGFAMFSVGNMGGANVYGVSTGMVGFIYIPFAVLYYFPSKYLYDFSVYAKQALILNDQESITYAFSRLKSMFRFVGILTIIILIFYAIILVIGVSAGLLAAFMK